MDHLNKPYIFYDEEIISPEKINRSRKEEQFTDVILITPDGSKHHVHKIIIATRCSYFEGLFNSRLRESTQAEIQLDHNISEKIINYIYTGHIEINAENAFVINESSNFLLLSKLKEASEKVLANNINIENILTLWRWAEISFNNELKKKCCDFVLSKTELFLEKHLLSLNYDEITEIATNTGLADDKLYLNLVKWIKDDYENRQNYIEDLLKYVDLAELSNDFRMKEIQTDEILFNNIKFLKIMTLNKKSIGKEEKKDDLIFAILETDIAVLKLKKSYPRLAPIIQHDFDDFLEPIYCKEDKILFCGVDYKNKECKSFSYRTKVFNDVSPMFEGRTGFGITKLHDKIYVCGGVENNGSVEIYDINADKWIYGKSMSKKQIFDFKTTNFNGSIYTFGGRRQNNQSFASNIIQRYDPRENSWETVSYDSIEMLYVHKAFVVQENGISCIYDNDFTEICGYDVRNNYMFKVPSEIPHLRYSSVCQSKDNVYIIGFNEDQNGEKTFGQLTNLSALGPVEFKEISDINLCYLDEFVVNFVNVESTL